MVIRFVDVARLIRFAQHPTMTACWIWEGRLLKGCPVTGTNAMARREVYERILGRPPAPDRQLLMQCERRLCVNPHHTTVEQAA